MPLGQALPETAIVAIEEWILGLNARLLSAFNEVEGRLLGLREAYAAGASEREGSAVGKE